jgi:hypothetical protein
MSLIVNVKGSISDLVYACLGEGEDHVYEHTQHPDWDWYSFANDKATMLKFLDQPVRRYNASLDAEHCKNLKLALQYLLNSDEPIPRKPGLWKYRPEMIAKDGGITQYLFGSFQDTICPYDSYALCEWIWEILYGNEDWHTDISNWVMSDSWL